MNKSITVLNDLLSPLLRSQFQSCVNEYGGDFRVRNLNCWNLLKLCVYGQISATASSRDMECFLQANRNKLYHWGLSVVSRSNFCHALENRDSRIFERAYEELAEKAKMQAGRYGRRFKNPVKAIDATTIEVSLKRYDWAHFRAAKGAIKLHTRIDADCFFPDKVIISDGSVHEVKKMGYLCTESGVIYTMDRAYDDYNSLQDIELQNSFFVIRMKKNCAYKTLSVFRQSESEAVRQDADIVFTGIKAEKQYPRMLRMVAYHDEEYDRDYVFLTNNFTLQAQEIADVYKTRWQIELFFKWIKQNLKIKTFWGTSENAVRLQIWIALILALLLWLHKSMLLVHYSTHTLLQLIRTAVMSRNTILGLCQKTAPPLGYEKQLNLGDFLC